MNYLLAGLRFILFVVILIGYLVGFGLFTLCLGYSLPRVLKWKKSFCQLMLKLLGVVIIKEGRPYQAGACLVINNHRSYLDPIIAMTEYLAVAVSKAEVKKWPLIGIGALISGVIYVKRELQHSRVEARRAIGQALRKGTSVYICPEGTTSLQPTTLPFRKSVFLLAAEESFPIIPVTIEYANLEMAFVGQDTFLLHFMRTFGRLTNPVMMVMGDPLRGSDGEDLLRRCQENIDQTLVYCRQKLQEVYPKDYTHSRTFP